MKMRNFGSLLLLSVLLAGAVIYHDQVGTAVLSAGSRCVTVILPSLYLFSILAAFFVNSGLLSWTAQPFRKMGGQMLGVLLFSQIAGYPVGAQLLHRMCKNGNITASQERMLLCACVSAGPAFLLGTVCGGASYKIKILLMASITIPNLLLGILMMVFCGRNEKKESRKPVINAVIFQQSVENGAGAMVKICSMILLFAALQAVGEETFGRLLSERAMPLLHSILEISCLTEFMQNGGNLPMAAALLSFGGICVHLQLAAVCEGNVPWLRFWGCRILCSAAAFGICRVGMLALKTGEIPVNLAIPAAFSEPSAESVIPGLCLVIMSLWLAGRAGEFSEKVQPSKTHMKKCIIKE